MGIAEVRGWLGNPEWPLFGPGIGRGPLDPGRTAARLAVEQALDVIERDSLDAAWAEAEASLPEGWGLSIAIRLDRSASAMAGPNDWDLYGGSEASATGPTPAAALRALAARLRER